ncbi:hypothetical protein [Humibacillus xanthopallidus]|uniref:hypothetical protein n=1 Tax=Humibacillus xanthopallidus TaxID=412689 RepID=UPI001152F582|nr:hypothetical protein [Humibacillus xanthopallidus]
MAFDSWGAKAARAFSNRVSAPSWPASAAASKSARIASTSSPAASTPFRASFSYFLASFSRAFSWPSSFWP